MVGNISVVSFLFFFSNNVCNNQTSPFTELFVVCLYSHFLLTSFNTYRHQLRVAKFETFTVHFSTPLFLLFILSLYSINHSFFLPDDNGTMICFFPNSMHSICVPFVWQWSTPIAVVWQAWKFDKRGHMEFFVYRCKIDMGRWQLQLWCISKINLKSKQRKHIIYDSFLFAPHWILYVTENLKLAINTNV